VATHRGRALRRRLCLIGVTATAALALAVDAAFGSTTVYWGYNNLTANNPPAGTCPGATSGVACSGWNNWDYSEADWNSGRSTWTLGFWCQSDGRIHGRLFFGYETFKTYDMLWSTYCPTHYNKAAVAHVNGGTETYNYLQARALHFP
jgi:hypothetical protein